MTCAIHRDIPTGITQKRVVPATHPPTPSEIQACHPVKRGPFQSTYRIYPIAPQSAPCIARDARFLAGTPRNPSRLSGVLEPAEWGRLVNL